jgi:hypothetical protein
MLRTFSAYCLALALAAAVLPSGAQEMLYERPIGASGDALHRPGAAEMAGDALVGRPLLLATTVLGAATFLVSLPFTITGRNVGEAADRLVGGPMRATFARCLGCVSPAQSTHSSQTRSYGEEYDPAY